MQTYRMNILPMLTWNKLRMNHTDIDLPNSFHTAKVSMLVEEGTAKVNDEERVRISSIKTGMGQDMEILIQNSGIDPILVSADRKKDAKVWLHIIRETENIDVCHVEVYARENSNLTLWLDYRSLENTKGTLAVSTKLYLEAGANVKLIQLGISSMEDNLLNDIGVAVGENATFESVALLLGGEKIFAGCKADLFGKHSKMEADVAYYGRGSQQIDMNYVADHRGVASESRMYASGVLDDSATKLFRGTINFITGAAQSIGDEAEEVLLLSDHIINQTIPLILCGEEDVAGNHGATIGKLDADMLFYLKSRGFSELEATIMIAKARIDAIGERLGDETLKEVLEQYLEGMFDEQRSK